MPPPKIRLITGTLAFSLVLVFTQFFSNRLIHDLSFWPEKIHAFEYWRLLSAHLLHFNVSHLFVNLVAFWVIVFIFYRQTTVTLLFAFLTFCCLGVDAGLYFWGAINQEYLGLSGALHGLAIAGAIYNQEYSKLKRFTFIGIIFIKVIYENIVDVNDNLLGLHHSFVVATEAHAFGAITGLLIGIIAVSFSLKARAHLTARLSASEDRKI